MAKTEAYHDTVRAAGLRATRPRVAVFRYLTESRAPLSHGEVAGALADTGIDRATIYRNLTDLVEAGVIHRIDLGDHVWRFVVPGKGQTLSNADHPHFICSSCGMVECLPEDAVAVRLTRRAPRALRQQGLQIQVRGLCDNCR